MTIKLLGLALLAIVPSAQANELASFGCTGLKVVGAQESSNAKFSYIVSGDEKNPPLVAEVIGLPGEAPVRLNYQDVFGIGQAPDGTLIRAPKNEGDGTVQALCEADDYNTLFTVRKNEATYCAKCERK